MGLSFIHAAKALTPAPQHAPDVLTIQAPNMAVTKTVVSPEDVGKVISFKLDLPSKPASEITLEQALNVLDSYGFKIDQVSVQSDTANYGLIGGGSHSFFKNSSIEVAITVYPPSGKYNEVMTALTANKIGNY